MESDSQLLRQFVDSGSQDAFAALVGRHVNFVYSAAVRQLGGDSHLAWDASQGVFLALAQAAHRLVEHVTLTGWLYTTTRFICAKIVRTRQRSRVREQRLTAMNETLDQSAPMPNWSEVRPVIDAAIHELRVKDRESLLLRFFEGRSFGEIGILFGQSESAARMRVDRALHKLRGRLARRGVTSTAAALGAGLTANAVSAAPAGLHHAIASLSFASLTHPVAGGATGFAWLDFMTIQGKTAVAVGIAALVVSGFLAAQWSRRSLATSTSRQARSVNSALTAENLPNAGPSIPLATRAAEAARAQSAVSVAAAKNSTPAAENPAAMAALAASVRGNLDQVYGGMFRRFKLSGSELQQFKDLLTERQLSSLDVITAAQTQGVNLEAANGELRAATDRARAETDQRIQALLGDERFQHYLEFNRHASSYARVDEIERHLSYTNAPLAGAQGEQLLRVLMDTSPSEAPVPLPAFDEMQKVFGNDDPFVVAKARGPISDETIARAGTILSAAQIDVLRQIQAEQRNEANVLRSLARSPDGNP